MRSNLIVLDGGPLYAPLKARIRAKFNELGLNDCTTCLVLSVLMITNSRNFSDPDSSVHVCILYPLNSPLTEFGFTGFQETSADLGPTTCLRVKFSGASVGMSSPEYPIFSSAATLASPRVEIE